ncbi:hypothetical protein [Amycolatopsis sp. NPDC054798]
MSYDPDVDPEASLLFLAVWPFLEAAALVAFLALALPVALITSACRLIRKHLTGSEGT